MRQNRPGGIHLTIKVGFYMIYNNNNNNKNNKNKSNNTKKTSTTTTKTTFLGCDTIELNLVLEIFWIKFI